MKEKFRCSAEQVKKYALDLISDHSSKEEIRQHFRECPGCLELFEQETNLSQQIRKLPRVVVPLDFSMAVMQKVRAEAGVSSRSRKTWQVWSLAASSVILIGLIGTYWPEFISNPFWDQVIIDSFSILVRTLESGIRASLAVGHAMILTLQMIGGVLAYFSRSSAGLPSLWFMALTTLFLFSHFLLFYLLRHQERNTCK